MLYAVFKFLHILGVVLLLGNVTVTSVWKVFADRTRQPTVVAHAQRLVTITDWGLTGSGIVLLMVGGYGMAWTARLSLTGSWLLWSQLLFLASGLVWLGVLVPLQGRQTALASAFRNGEADVPPAYWTLSRRWLQWGVAATVPLVAALFLMVVK